MRTSECAICGESPATSVPFHSEPGTMILLCGAHRSEFDRRKYRPDEQARPSHFVGFTPVGTAETGQGPHWTKTPPSERGWYWTRRPGEPMKVRNLNLDYLRSVEGSGHDYEWWPVRVWEPPQ